MKKNLLSSNIALILTSTSLALVGCGGSSSSSSTADKAPATEIKNANVLCIDSNSNGKCDQDETKKVSATSGSIPAELRSTEFRTLLQLESGALFVAPAGSTNISAYSTLVNNELIFNPTINANAITASEYLTANSIPTALSAEQIAAFNTSLANAITVSESAHPFQVIAAISDQIIATGQFSVNVTEDNIIGQAAAKRALSFSEESIGWAAGDSDETPVATTILEGRNLAVIATKYHNNIIVIDTDSKQELKKTAFAQVAGDRYAIDAESGASEKPFSDVQASTDAQAVYISVSAKDDTSNAAAGLYRITISDNGSASAIGDTETKFYQNENIGKFFTLNNGNVLVQDIDSDSIVVLNSSLTKTGEIDNLAGLTLDEYSSVYPAPDGQSIYAVVNGNDSSATTLNRFASNTNTKTHSLDIEHKLDGLIFFSESNKALAYSQDSYAVIVDLTNLSIIKTLDVAGEEIETAAISENGKFVLLAGHDNKKLMIFDLASFESKPVKSVAVENRIRALTVSDDGLVVAAGGHPGSFAYIDTPVLGNVLTPNQLVAADKSMLTPSFINNGQDLSVVVNNLNMPTRIPSGAGADIVWTSTTTAITTTDTDRGTVTRPANADITANISATISYQFRDEDAVTDSSAFPLTVRKAPATLTGSEALSASSNYLYHIDSSPLGTSAIAVFSKAYTFNVLNRTAEGNLSYLLGNDNAAGDREHQEFPTEFAGSRPVGNQYLDEKHVLIAFPSGKDANDNTTPGALVTYDLSVDNLITIDGHIKAPVFMTTLLQGDIKGISHLNNNRLAVIEEVKVEGIEAVRNAVIYTVNGSALENPMRFAIANNASAIEVDSSGNSVFVISGSEIHKYSSGTVEPSAKTTTEFSPYMLAISDDALYSASDDGKLSGFRQTDLVEALSFNTGYGQRSRTLDVIADQAHMSVNGIGLVIVDLPTEQSNGQGTEQAIFAHSRQRRAATSDDGEWAFAAQYISKTENTFQLIKLK